MAAAVQLPGSGGHLHRIDRRARRTCGMPAVISFLILFGISVGIVAGIGAAVLGTPSNAWADSKPHHALRQRNLVLAHRAAAATAVFPSPATYLTRAAQPVVGVASPSPHPAPGSRAPSTYPSADRPSMPVPTPQAPPVQRPADQGVAFPHRAASLPDGTAIDDHATLSTTKLATVLPKKQRTRSHASGAITSDRLDQSLVYSSAFALVLAASGLLMLGSRRRLW